MPRLILRPVHAAKTISKVKPTGTSPSLERTFGLALGVGLWLSLMGFMAPSVHAQVYKWVDESGRVHFSDRRYAREGFQPLEAPPAAASDDGWLFTFTPQADAALLSNRNNAQGQTRFLSAGQWTARGNSYQVASLMRFDITPLLAHLHTSEPRKRVARAELTLYANTEDKLYGQGSANKEAPGHSTLQGSNAFYVKPSHNNWEESRVTWSQYYDPSHYTPSTIRNLPAVSAPTSGEDRERDYALDVTELLLALVRSNTREFTLELTPQRRSAMAQVTFFSREAQDKAPRLVIELEQAE